MSEAGSARTFVKASVHGLLVALLIVLFFSPSWVSFVAWHQRPAEFGDLVPVRRARSVVRQVADPFTEIVDPIHKIVRWRLFFPLIGHALGLPPVLVLLLSPAGAILVLTILIQRAHERGIDWLECDRLAIVFGASSWFFVATGWLGYFDSWLALSLLTVSFARRRALVVIVCLLAPWIDERFILGVPLAFLIRWVDTSAGSTSPPDHCRWLVAEAMLPVLAVALVAVIRIVLAGRGGSDDLGTYWHRVGFFHLPLTRLARGAWEGLRIGWFLAAVAVVLSKRRGAPLGASLLAAGAIGTMVVGLVSANDLSRAGTLVLPIVPLGWVLARSTGSWRYWRLDWVLPGLTLAIPAQHVVSDFVMPVNSIVTEVRALQESGLVAAPPRWGFRTSSAAQFSPGERPETQRSAEKGIGAACGPCSAASAATIDVDTPQRRRVHGT